MINQIWNIIHPMNVSDHVTYGGSPSPGVSWITLWTKSIKSISRISLQRKWTYWTTLYSLEKQVSMELDYAIHLRGLNGCKQYYVIVNINEQPFCCPWEPLLVNKLKNWTEWNIFSSLYLGTIKSWLSSWTLYPWQPTHSWNTGQTLKKDHKKGTVYTGQIMLKTTLWVPCILSHIKQISF